MGSRGYVDGRNGQRLSSWRRRIQHEVARRVEDLDPAAGGGELVEQARGRVELAVGADVLGERARRVMGVRHQARVERGLELFA